MFERTEAKSPAWRLFAFFTLALCLKVVFEGLRFDVGWPLARSAIGLVGLIGLTGYAYGIRIGPRLFWAGFSIFFSIGLMIRFGQQIAIARALPSGMQVPGSHTPAVLGLGLGIALLACLALFRQGGMFAGRNDGPPAPRLRRQAVAYGKVFD